MNDSHSHEQLAGSGVFGGWLQVQILHSKTSTKHARWHETYSGNPQSVTLEGKAPEPGDRLYRPKTTPHSPYPGAKSSVHHRIS